jgi:hypothetical protein
MDYYRISINIQKDLQPFFLLYFTTVCFIQNYDTDDLKEGVFDPITRR